MNNMDGKSMNILENNISELKKLFPEAVSDGEVDFDILKQLFGESTENTSEKYGLDWKGRADAFRLSQAQSLSTLRPVVSDSKDWDNTDNLYIEGDNLEVLRLLQKSYFGKVKMIYIDPPYNRDGDFLYKDAYSESLKGHKEFTGQIDSDGVKLTTNKEYSGRYHTDWLNMIYPRLRIAQNLLHKDGVIFISIDSVEQSNLRKVCDDVFGEHNFVSIFVWEKTQHFGRQKLNTYNNHDFVLCYAKELNSDAGLKQLLVEKVHGELEDAPLYNASNPVNTLVFPAGSTKFNMKDGVYKKSRDEKYILENPVTVKNGVNANKFSLTFNSRWSPAKVLEEHKKGTTYWVKTENFAIRAIYHDDKTTKVSLKEIIFTNQSSKNAAANRFGTVVETSEVATANLESLFKKKTFDYPKPSSLIEYFMAAMFNPELDTFDEDFIVMDFFAGSSTTAEAVMRLNAKDGGKRKFILVQIPEAIAEGHDAYKAGYKFITQVGRARIELAGERIKEELQKANLNPKKGENVIDPNDLDFGFRLFRLDKSNLKIWDPSKYDDIQTAMFDNIDPYIEGRTQLDVIFEIMLKTGLGLTSKMDEYTVGNSSIYSIDYGELMICLSGKITEDIADEMVKLYEQLKPVIWQVVFKDSGFASDTVKTNVKEILKTAGLAEDAFTTL